MELAGRNLREAMLRNSLTTWASRWAWRHSWPCFPLGIGLQKLVMNRLQGTGLFEPRVCERPPDWWKSDWAWRTCGSRDGINKVTKVQLRGLPSSIAAAAKTTDVHRAQQLAQLPNVVSVFPNCGSPPICDMAGTGHVTFSSQRTVRVSRHRPV